MEPFQLKNQSYFSIEKWVNQFSGLVAGITTKNGGISKGVYKDLNLGFHVGDVQNDVISNRTQLSKTLNFPLNCWVSAEQTHDITIRRVTNIDKGRGARSYEQAFKGTDGFYTNEENILLTLCYADCVPLFFIAPAQRMIGTAHAGWKGTVNEIGRHMIEAWCKEGINPDEILVVIGPSICEKCYIVNDYVINFVENTLEDVEEKPYNLINDGQYTLDLREMNRLILKRAGVPDQNIIKTELCTSCHNKEFFSHRRDQGKTGRILGFIGWKEAVN
jgi:polyphenol oxidase